MARVLCHRPPAPGGSRSAAHASRSRCRRGRSPAMARPPSCAVQRQHLRHEQGCPGLWYCCQNRDKSCKSCDKRRWKGSGRQRKVAVGSGKQRRCIALTPEHGPTAPPPPRTRPACALRRRFARASVWLTCCAILVVVWWWFVSVPAGMRRRRPVEARAPGGTHSGRGSSARSRA